MLGFVLGGRAAIHTKTHGFNVFSSPFYILQHIPAVKVKMNPPMRSRVMIFSLGVLGLSYKSSFVPAQIGISTRD
jgi:hypothetical protein